MNNINKDIYNVTIDKKAQKYFCQLLEETPEIEKIFKRSNSVKSVEKKLRQWVLQKIKTKPYVLKIFKKNTIWREDFESLEWEDFAAIRLLDYLNYTGIEIEDPNLHGQKIINDPFKHLWLAYKNGRGGGTPAFFKDMLELFRQFSGKDNRLKITKSKVKEWMDRHPSGLEERVIKLRKINRDRIIKILIKKIEEGKIKSSSFVFKPGLSKKEKLQQAREWWNNYRFHLRFAVRTPEMLNELLDYSLSPETMNILRQAQDKGIPFFVNPYYLSLLIVDAPEFAVGVDLAIKDYILYSKELVEEFGQIVAWEKEDIVKPGEANAAGWILPTEHNIHRRYPDVAILIPDTMGRACGGLCASCQRMYDFQNGRLNFKMETLKPTESWDKRLRKLMDYFENDSQLRDILITGGDALMSSSKSLDKILNEVYNMACRKKKTNLKRDHREKYAEILRVRLGTRLLAYLPQKINNSLIKVLKKFQKKARKIGIRQFVIQTHFESPMEITPAAKKAIDKILSAGWIITNQLVFTAAASRRGHTAKLRKVLNDVGILTYYTFTCKGHNENYHNFSTNARAVQEQAEEKIIGKIPGNFYKESVSFTQDAENIKQNINKLRKTANIPFLATDRNVLNIPAVGKSLTFRINGITYDGRRILEYDHDYNRAHSPIIEQMGKVEIIESKSIYDYLNQIEEMGEDISEYKGIFGYSMGATEKVLPMYKYPQYEFKVTREVTNFGLDIFGLEE